MNRDSAYRTLRAYVWLRRLAVAFLLVAWLGLRSSELAAFSADFIAACFLLLAVSWRRTFGDLRP